MIKSAIGAVATAIVLGGALAPPATAAGAATHHHHHHRHYRLVRVGQLRPGIKQYRGYVANLIHELGPQVRQISTLATLDDTAGAESAWLTAHLTWLRIGEDDGAYGAFGNLGLHIDGTAAGLTHGTSDNRFTGFHKIELDLWTDNDPVVAAVDANRLSQYVKTLAKYPLKKAFPPHADGIENWVLRTHEIIEDAVRDSLSGDDNYGSGTDAASVTADIAATREMLKLLAPQLRPRSPHLVHRARGELTTALAAADATKRGGKWVAVTAMTRSHRERLDAAIGAADETLAPVPDLLRLPHT